MRLLIGWLVLLGSILVGSSDLQAGGRVGYITGVDQPWGWKGSDNVTAMNTVFGAGGWRQLNWVSGTSALTSGEYCFLFVDGSAQNSLDFNTFVDTNRGALESFVGTGHSLFLNAARWSGNDPSIDLGFGVTLSSFNVGFTGTATAEAQATSIIDGPFGLTGTSWTGGFFSHSSLSGSFGTTYITEEDSSVTLAGKSYGDGFVLFGGLTIPYWQSPQPEVFALRANTLNFAYHEVCPEPSSLALCGAAGAVLAVWTAKRRRVR